MTKKNNKLMALILLSTIGITPIASYSTNIPLYSKKFSLKLSRDRLILKQNSIGSELDVINEHDYPVLVQSRVYASDGVTKDKSYFAAPPLFKLNGDEQNKIRVAPTINNLTNKEQEELYWLCVKGIPPKESDVWVNNNKIIKDNIAMGINIAIDNCVKLIIRPKNLSELSYNSKPNIRWNIVDGGIIAKNETPYILSLKNIKIHDQTLENPGYLTPYSSKKISLKTDIKSIRKISWQFITDLGGNSNVIESDIN
ncbi:fimbria/pilus periplasmic chaperone [Citrobacter sp. 50677481]|uniref:fimbrial biogenesis chaperone n=1 Tax=Citrobacter sp. 50677481 TaxID=1736699 RepID=UPI000741FFBA|nr:fimbria/pilus periplasmic chaperone [Citrobacter sp. 50677481]KSY30500.1 hypothetical protein APU02_10180 [Citrobacter sp. 50677481]HCQ7757819.1 fimbria/pilus periplasmic chaperone [Citrobacter sedlakii]